MTMEALRSLLAERGVQVYFLVLGLAIRGCMSSYFSAATRRGRGSARSLLHLAPPLLSLLIISLTWYYIIRFILNHLETSESYFDDAYKDVLRGDRYFTSTQLLTWAIVAVIWTADEGAPLSFLLFGFLGAMGASFVLWVPSIDPRNEQSSKRRTLPIGYVASSAVAFAAILNLRPCITQDDETCTQDLGFGSFPISFRYWLQALHVTLLLPVLASWLWPSQPHVDAATLYGVLAVLFASWHLMQSSGGASYAIPVTDCQKSITADLVCCSAITLYAVYRHVARSMSSSSLTKATLRLSLAALGLILVSPAAVLAAYICSRRLQASHMEFVAYLQRSVANRLRKAEQQETSASTKDSGVAGHATVATNVKQEWCNLGLWVDESAKADNAKGYDEACERLALELGHAADLGSADSVLCCGCGSGAELELYKERFQPRNITGIDTCLDEARYGLGKDFNVRVLRAGVDELRFPPSYFDKILALDNAYHYPRKYSFFQTCAGMLSPAGKVAVTDILVNNERPPWFVRTALLVMGIPSGNLWTEEQYRKHLLSIGFVDIEIKRVGRQVFLAWKRFLPEGFLKRLDYAVITAVAQGNRSLAPPQKKVAIIGSGLAGLTASHYITSRTSEVSVTIYESRDRPGLAGHTALIGPQLVDVPARMAAIAYYTRYKELLDRLDIPTRIVPTDCAYYMRDGAEVVRTYEASSWSNIYNAVVFGGLSNLWQQIVALTNIDEHSEWDTFGDWLRDHFRLPSTDASTSKTNGNISKTAFPSFVWRGNPFVSMMIGSLCWMLSCTYNQLIKYPADIVLPYMGGLDMRRLGLFRRGQVVRVVPSIKVLERALLHGVDKLCCDQRIVDVDEKKVIDGVEYDAVIIATEARAVPHVVKDCATVFSAFRYHPSAVFLHTDESFMPTNRKKWRCWNVEMSADHDGPQLTFWLNKFYPDASFETNVFQTWAPFRSPKNDAIIQESKFERVVHTKATKELVTKIDAEQGKRGIYYAGSYCVYGMGLLEEALKSGEHTAEKVLTDLLRNHSLK